MNQFNPLCRQNSLNLSIIGLDIHTSFALFCQGVHLPHDRTRNRLRPAIRHLRWAVHHAYEADPAMEVGKHLAGLYRHQLSDRPTHACGLHGSTVGSTRLIASLAISVPARSFRTSTPGQACELFEIDLKIPLTEEEHVRFPWQDRNAACRGSNSEGAFFSNWARPRT